MYLSRIQIENIRGFRSGDLRIDLDLQRPDGRYAGWTVVAGRNGTGKTSFLKSIALTMLGSSWAYSVQQSLAGWVRMGQRDAFIALYLDVDSALDKVDASEELSGRSALPGQLRLHVLGGSTEPKLVAGVVYNIGTKAPDTETEEPVHRGPWATNAQGWFIAGYGAYRRLTGHAPDAQRLMSGPTRLARLVSLFREDASLIESIQWLRELHLRRLEQREGAAQLLKSVLELLNDGLLPDSTKVVDVDSEGLWVEQRGVKLTLTDMSDGFRTTAALVVDLARQLHATYQEFRLEERDGRQCVPYPGVVLIDEVELHLHVSWQQRIGFWLKEHFPNIQFIVTTHSPFICQAADPKGLIRLPAPGEERVAEHVSDDLYRTVVNGTVDEAVLTELFGLEHVHSNQSERLRKRVAELEVRALDGKASAEEREELERLAAQLPSTGSALVDRAVRKFKLDE